MVRPLGPSIRAGLSARLAASANTKSGSEVLGMVTSGEGLRMIVAVIGLSPSAPGRAPKSVRSGWWSGGPYRQGADAAGQGDDPGEPFGLGRLGAGRHPGLVLQPLVGVGLGDGGAAGLAQQVDGDEGVAHDDALLVGTVPLRSLVGCGSGRQAWFSRGSMKLGLRRVRAGWSQWWWRAGGAATPPSGSTSGRLRSRS